MFVLLLLCVCLFVGVFVCCPFPWSVKEREVRDASRCPPFLSESIAVVLFSDRQDVKCRLNRPTKKRQNQ